jgi:uncharacterized membrane protein SpoIIM required for sporulation
MDLAQFIQQRRPQWQQLEAILKRVEGSGLSCLDDAQAVEFGRLYRCAASDLNQAQTFVSGNATVQYLNDLVARCYLVIYSRRRIDLRAVLRHLVWGFPAAFRRHFAAVLLAILLFTGGAIVGFVASLVDPVSRDFLFPSDFAHIEPEKEGEAEQRAMSTDQLQAFSSFLFLNNMSVSLVAFALGITFGIGTAWMLWYNGILMGVLAAVFWEAGQITAFCTGVLPHGVLEIPAIWIAGGAGFLLAGGMLRARPWPRREELIRTGKEALLLVAGCFPLLIIAAVLEAVVARAPDQFLNTGVKLAVAAVFAVLFLIYVLLGWKQPPLATRPESS